MDEVRWIETNIYKGVPMKTALLLIDIQKTTFAVAKMELVNPLEAAKKACMLPQCFREHGGHHIHIQHISLKPDATFFIKGESGSDIHDSVAHFEWASRLFTNIIPTLSVIQICSKC